MTMTTTTETTKENRYLIYRVGTELYGSPLLEVREVVEYQSPKYMPNMEPYFSGVINIRGSIVGVIDLRKKFSAPSDVSRYTALLVCESSTGAIAAIVDQVEKVVPIDESVIEKKPPVISRVESDYLLGVANVGNQLITLVHLRPALMEMKLIQVKAA